jgi:hypothetical protein
MRAKNSPRKAATALPKAGAKSKGRSGDRSIPVAFRAEWPISPVHSCPRNTSFANSNDNRCRGTITSHNWEKTDAKSTHLKPSPA